MKLPERLIPALVVLLLTAVVAPLCVAAGFDSCGDGCCELAARLCRASNTSPEGAGSVVAIADSHVGSHRTAISSARADDRHGWALGPHPSALPLRV